MCGGVGGGVLEWCALVRHGHPTKPWADYDLVFGPACTTPSHPPAPPSHPSKPLHTHRSPLSAAKATPCLTMDVNQLPTVKHLNNNLAMLKQLTGTSEMMVRGMVENVAMAAGIVKQELGRALAAAAAGSAQEGPAVEELKQDKVNLEQIMAGKDEEIKRLRDEATNAAQEIAALKTQVAALEEHHREQDAAAAAAAAVVHAAAGVAATATAAPIPMLQQVATAKGGGAGAADAAGVAVAGGAHGAADATCKMAVGSPARKRNFLEESDNEDEDKDEEGNDSVDTTPPPKRRSVAPSPSPLSAVEQEIYDLMKAYGSGAYKAVFCKMLADNKVLPPSARESVEAFKAHMRKPETPGQCLAYCIERNDSQIKGAVADLFTIVHVDASFLKSSYRKRAGGVPLVMPVAMGSAAPATTTCFASGSAAAGAEAAGSSNSSVVEA